jgi:hypothetical protein
MKAEKNLWSTAVENVASADPIEVRVVRKDVAPVKDPVRSAVRTASPAGPVRSAGVVRKGQNHLRPRWR